MFAFVWGACVGWLSFEYRQEYAKALKSVGLAGYPAFAATVIAVSIAEECLCALFGCTLAVPTLWADLIFVVSIWLAWLSTFYFYIALRYKFDYDEVLLVAAVAGLLFEIVTKPSALASPLIAFIAAGPVIMVCARITALPLGLVEWKGHRDGWMKYPIAFFVPFMASAVALIPVFIFLTAIRAPL